jgi:hypothetical protein
MSAQIKPSQKESKDVYMMAHKSFDVPPLGDNGFMDSLKSDKTLNRSPQK